MKVQPYLFFEGRCEEALAFYQQAIGAQVGQLMRYGDSPDPPPPGMVPPGSENKVMHADFMVGETQLLASDGSCSGTPKLAGTTLALEAADVPETHRLFDALSKGGKVEMPMMKTFFSPAFGSVVDQFGLSWMVMVRQPESAV